jgi:hypothetical protein
MAKSSSTDTPVTSADLAVNVERVVDEAPDLPKATVSSEPAPPTIDTGLIALRNAQAAAEAQRFAGK